MDMKKEYNLEIEPKVEKMLWPISIYEFLKEVGFDLSIPGKIYVDDSTKGYNEIIYEYNNKKYNIRLCSNNYVEIIEYYYCYDCNKKLRRYQGSYSLYKIKRNFFSKALSIETKHLSIDGIACYKKNENGKLVETSYEECEFWVPYQEVHRVKDEFWALRIGTPYYEEKFPYYMDLIYKHRGDKEFKVKVDVINQRLKEYFANVNMDIPLIDVIKKICEINLITLDDLMDSYLSFGITENKENPKDSVSKYLIIKDGILKITENGETVEYVKDYVPKTKKRQ